MNAKNLSFSPDDIYQRAKVLYQSGQLEKAAKLYKDLIKRFPMRQEFLTDLGTILLQLDKTQEGVKLLERSLKIDPNQAMAFSNCGIGLQYLDRFEDALASYNCALALDPKLVEAYSNRGFVLNKLNRLDESLASCDMALALNQNFVQAHINRSSTLVKLKRLDEALASADRALVINPILAEAHHNRGVVLRALERGDDAIACFTRAIKLQPNFIDAHKNLGDTLDELGRQDEAVPCFKRILEITPNDISAHFALGNILGFLKRSDEATAHFKRCLKIDPQDSLGAGLMLARLGLGPIPARAPDALLHKLYIERAQRWDNTKGKSGQGYCGHELVVEVLKNQLKISSPDILDAGCGSGLVGTLISDLANRLDGVDMSAAMLEKANEKNIYTQLCQDDLVSFMTNHNDCYDAVTCAATLIHFGDLASAFEAAATCLRDDGIFVFTLFPNDGEFSEQDFIVATNLGYATGGCYAHSSSYVRRIAESTGFTVEILDSVIHEYEFGTPVMGLIVALRRQVRTAETSQ